jgi:hypothetical protein
MKLYAVRQFLCGLYHFLEFVFWFLNSTHKYISVSFLSDFNKPAVISMYAILLIISFHIDSWKKSQQWSYIGR